MKTRMTAAVLAAAMTCAGGALAGDGKSRLSIGATLADFEGAEVGLVTARYNYTLADYVSVEGELSHGVTEEDISAASLTGDVSIGLTGAAFVVAQVPLDARGSNVFARVGYQVGEIEVEIDGVGSADFDADGWAYGIGGNLMLNEVSGVRADYTRFDAEIDDTGGLEGEIDLYSVSYVAKF